MRRNSDDNMKPIRRAQGEHETINNKLETHSKCSGRAGNLKQETRYSLRSLKFMVYGFKFIRGQSLIEVLVAFTVSIIVGMALVSAGLATQRASISARNKSQATKLAQEYLEELRLMRDARGFSGFQSLIGGNYSRCNYIKLNSSTDPSAWELYRFSISACDANLNVLTNPSNSDQPTLNNTKFSRGVHFVNITANVSLKAVVFVQWTEGVNIRTVSEETTFTKWCDGGVDGIPNGNCL